MTGGAPRWRLVRAGTDAVPARVRRFFMAARRRRGLGLSRRGWSLVAGVTGLVLLAGWLVWGTPLFGVREVRVTGTGILTGAEVRRAAAVPARVPLARVDPAEVAARVSTLPPVAEVAVRRSWPDTITIEVVERVAVAAVPVGTGYGLLDVEGVVFDRAPAQPAGLPLVEVADPGPEDPATRSALTVLAALTPALRAELTSLTVAGPVDIRLTLASGWTVIWGDESASGTKARVATALLDEPGDVIDVSTPEVVGLR